MNAAERAELDALDRGLVEIGVASAQATARLDARLTALFAAIDAACIDAGLRPAPPARPRDRHGMHVVGDGTR